MHPPLTHIGRSCSLTPLQVVEEYALIAAAIPAHVKYGGDYWEMTLRGGGERNVQVGNIFSGLFCNVKDKKGMDNPEVVRMPGRAKSYSVLPESEHLTMRLREMRKSLRELRPFKAPATAADALMLTGQNLFTWAEDSSIEYMDQLQARPSAHTHVCPVYVPLMATSLAHLTSVSAILIHISARTEGRPRGRQAPKAGGGSGGAARQRGAQATRGS